MSKFHFIGKFDQQIKKRIGLLYASSQSSRIYRNAEFTVIANPRGIYPPFHVYPLAKKLKVDNNFSIILTDMDGTTTSTEILCLHSLGYMMKQICGPRFSFQRSDFLNIIGNSTTKHVEYLLRKYKNRINNRLLQKKAYSSAHWTVKNVPDRKRAKEAEAVLKKNFDFPVKLAIEIYYARYHSILEDIKKEKSDELSSQLTNGKPLIKPMEDVSLFLALTTGILREEAEKLGRNESEKKKLKKISKLFSKKRIRVGLITSSIFYEADIVLKEVFKKIRTEVKNWPITEQTKKLLIEKFSSYENFYDTVVTADDSSEIRLKPHRDLYSLAIFNLGIKNKDFKSILGFEDSTSGVISLRAAGVGKIVAVPFRQSENHDFSAASIICRSGLREFLFEKLKV